MLVRIGSARLASKPANPPRWLTNKFFFFFNETDFFAKVSIFLRCFLSLFFERVSRGTFPLKTFKQISHKHRILLLVARFKSCLRPRGLHNCVTKFKLSEITLDIVQSCKTNITAIYMSCGIYTKGVSFGRMPVRIRNLSSVSGFKSKSKYPYACLVASL